MLNSLACFHVIKDSQSSSDDRAHNLDQLFFNSAATRPDHPALLEFDETARLAAETSYGALAGEVRQLARHLIARGVRPGDRVLLALPRGGDAIRAQIAILAAGAAFVPVDVSAPIERIVFVAADAATTLAICKGSKAAELAAAGLPVLDLDAAKHQISAEASEPSSPIGVHDGDAIAYVIYTSGTTGKPKGVAVRHRNVRHFVAAEGSILGLVPTDRVFQGFSHAFDMSIEEIWPALAAGATLVAATEAIAKSGPDVVDAVIAAEVTVWHAVPSLIRMIERDPPLLRILNLGGEACPPELVLRWWRPHRRILNTYGPTETTVTATWAELRPGDPVTIGKPLPGYEAYVLGDELLPVEDGAAGELCIAGGGVSAGYLNRPELTAEKFVTARVGASDGRTRLVYRTGDLVRRDRAGRLVFLGRIDTQVKIRGYRVELGEIESLILEDAKIRSAAVALHRRQTVGERLVAYLVPALGVEIDRSALRRRLCASLPDYMVPTTFDLLPSLPTLVSGKIDRNRLPPPTAPASGAEARRVAPRNAGERDIAAVCATVLGRDEVSIDADFFNDLGGHSLRAGQFVSKLREDDRYAHVSMGDVYRCRTVARIAAHLSSPQAVAATRSPIFIPVSRSRYRLCAAGQALVLAVAFGLSACGVLLPFAIFAEALSAGAGMFAAIAAGLGSSTLIGLLSLLLPLGVRGLIVGRLAPGVYPLWGLTYFRWWLFRLSLRSSLAPLLAGAPLMASYMRLLGAKVGKGALIATHTIDIPELLEIGEGATLCSGSVFSVSSVEAGTLILGRIEIGAGATIGLRASIGRGAVIGRDAVVDDLTLVGADCVVRDGETWAGSPGRARPRAAVTVETPLPRPASNAASATFAAAAGFIFLLPFCAAAPGMALLALLGNSNDASSYYLLTPLLALTFVTSLAGLVATTKWVVCGRIEPRSAPYWSGFHLRLWVVERACEMALAMLHPLYGTLYLRPFYRLLGMRFGRRAEVTTASGILHDLVTIGEESFIADGVVLGAPHFARGLLTVDSTGIGRRSFVGNSALIPQRSAIGDRVLIGALSRPPQSNIEQARAGISWFGSPAIYLPQRQQAPAFDVGVTFDPPMPLVAQRLAIEAVRIVLPIALVAVLTIALIDFYSAAREARWPLSSLIALSPLAGVSVGLAAFTFVASVKWTLMGRYKPTVAPLWSHFVWFTEMVTAFYEYLAVPLLLAPLRARRFSPCSFEFSERASGGARSSTRPTSPNSISSRSVTMRL
jgi:non-ribosomal peptide synthetase-like protein